MKTEREIKEEIESLKNSRDICLVGTREWTMFDFAIRELERVVEG